MRFYGANSTVVANTNNFIETCVGMACLSDKNIYKIPSDYSSSQLKVNSCSRHHENSRSQIRKKRGLFGQISH